MGLGDLAERQSALIDERAAIIIPGHVADVAQLVEQRIRNAKVVSSIPIIGTSVINRLAPVRSWGFSILWFLVRYLLVNLAYSFQLICVVLVRGIPLVCMGLDGLLAH